VSGESPHQSFRLSDSSTGPRFDGIGAVNGGGATSVLLKDYAEPQRSQILDLVFQPKFGASVSTMLVEIPGDGNATQGSMPSHQHSRGDLDFQRGYTWWVLSQAKQRNPRLTLDATAWSAPGWVGNGRFWSTDAAEYYASWLHGLRHVHGLELDAIGCRNEKGPSLEFARELRQVLDAHGFDEVQLHAFDDWPADKFDFVRDLAEDEAARNAIDIVGAHVLCDRRPGRPSGHAPASVQRQLAAWGKPLWNTEDHVYEQGFDCLIGIVECFNDSYLMSGATKTVLWYDIAGVYPVEPYAEEPAMLLARSPWSGHYQIREALWGYAHYGQFTEQGWRYLDGGCAPLLGNGSVVSLASSDGDYSIIIETNEAAEPQVLRFEVAPSLRSGDLCVWRSTAAEQFVRQHDVRLEHGAFTIRVEPAAVYSLSTTRGQHKGGFTDVPPADRFPFPYRETFSDYDEPERYGRLPRYTADISGAFELTDRPDGKGLCLRQMAPVPTISWAPDWMPYTIVGDDQWADYEVAVDVWLAPGEMAGVMARVNHVGTGYGFVPQCYIFELSADGTCNLLVLRGKANKRELVGDAEQQAIITAQADLGRGGSLKLGRAHMDDVAHGHWHRLALRCDGSTITGLVDGRAVVHATDATFARGQAGLIAGGPPIEDPAGLAGRSEAAEGVLSRPYYADLTISSIGALAPEPSTAPFGSSPLYSAHSTDIR
jgi:galactosylceramidase